MELHTSELLDLVDDNDNVIGTIERTDAYKNNIDNIRVIDCFIKNSEGKLFIPRRHPNKRMFPLALDTSVGGHVDAGETYEKAFFREAQEELGIDVSAMKYRHIGTMTPKADGTHAFISVYEIESNETPNYNKDDFIEYFWLTPEEIIKKIESGDTSKDHLPMILKKFYL
jgi:isopentenyl-diphosphate delta-isomerase